MKLNNYIILSSATTASTGTTYTVNTYDKFTAVFNVSPIGTSPVSGVLKLDASLDNSNWFNINTYTYSGNLSTSSPNYYVQFDGPIDKIRASVTPYILGTGVTGAKLTGTFNGTLRAMY